MPSLDAMRGTIPFLQKALHLDRDYPPRPGLISQSSKLLEVFLVFARNHWEGTLPPVVAGSVVPRTHNVTVEKILVQPHVLAGHLPPPKIPQHT